MSRHRNRPPFTPTDFREHCPRCHHSGIQALARNGLYECGRCSAVFYACPYCGARWFDYGEDGRPNGCMACSRPIGATLIV